jgi:hypothetical protein
MPRARDEACVDAGVRIEPQRAKEVCCRGGDANDKYCSEEFTQPMTLHFSQRRKPLIGDQTDFAPALSKKM